VTLEDGTITSYISVNVIDPSGEVLLNRIGTMPVYLNASANLPHLIKDGFFEGIYVGTDSVRKTWMSFGEIKKYDDSDNLANYMSCRLTFPRDIEALSELPTKEINAPYTYPGTGNYLKDENGEYQYVKSRNVRIRVVGTPKKLVGVIFGMKIMVNYHHCKKLILTLQQWKDLVKENIDI